MNLLNVTGAVRSLLRRLVGRWISPEVRLFSYMPQWPGCGAEREMNSLIWLPHSTAFRTAITETADIPDGTSHAHRCVSCSRSVGSYHSRRLLQWYVRQEDGALTTFLCAWLIDFARPANFRVTQVTGGELSYNDFDRWATIGEERYEWTSFQLTGHSQPELHHRGNQLLTIDKWLTLLAKVHLLVGASLCRALGRRYLVLDYEASTPSGVLTEELSPEVSGYREKACAWIDEATGRLAKCVLEVTDQARLAAELPPNKLQQIFGGYDHDMGFDAGTPFPELEDMRRSAHVRSD